MHMNTTLRRKLSHTYMCMCTGPPACFIGCASTSNLIKCSMCVLHYINSNTFILLCHSIKPKHASSKGACEYLDLEFAKERQLQLHRLPPICRSCLCSLPGHHPVLPGLLCGASHRNHRSTPLHHDHSITITYMHDHVGPVLSEQLLSNTPDAVLHFNRS